MSPRRALRAAATVLMVSGALLLTDAALTLAWQEPVSALMARITQDRLAGDLEDLERLGPTGVERRALQTIQGDDRRVAFLARSLRARAADGDAVGRIDIPALGVDFVLVKGTDDADLRRGPGLYDDTPFPGVPGTTAIAGHRTTYLAPFRRLDDLDRGDEVHVTMPYGRFTYVVGTRKIVPADEVSVIRRVDHDRLVLSACHPLYSAEERIVVFARLRRVEPRGAALQLGSSSGGLQSSPDTSGADGAQR